MKKASPDARPRRVTIADVAREAGVAISSVSAALNDQPGVSDATRQRVKEEAAALGYVPSMRGRSLSTQRAFAVGLVVERDPDVLESDPFFGAFIGGVEETISSHGYVLALSLTQGSTATMQRHAELVKSRRVDGVLLNELTVDDPRIPLVTELGVPAVGVNPDRRDFPFPAVRQEGVEAINGLVRTLVRLGHARIAHVAGPPAFVHSVERLEAWQAAMRREGLEPDLVSEGGFTYEGGRQAAEVLLTMEDRPTAVFCANDQSAIGFMNRALELGLDIPGDLSVSGFDGNRVGEFLHPPLTTIRTSPRQLGGEAARLLLAAIDGDSPADVELAPARLVVRGSTARLRDVGHSGR